MSLGNNSSVLSANLALQNILQLKKHKDEEGTSVASTTILKFESMSLAERGWVWSISISVNT